MTRSYTLVLMVLVLTAVFAGIALPEIYNRLLVTQETAPGLTDPLDQAITALVYFLPVGVLAIFASLLLIARRK
mgnify:CR=1|jgi:hypothetical protein|tara:strand:- start:153 stop:374 length:222 start_codon:yes stop_codon:yes gene_type:complete